MFSLLVGFIMIAVLGSPVFAEDGQRWKLSGQVMIDSDIYEQVHSKDVDNSNRETMLRLARLQLNYNLRNGWQGKLQLDGKLDALGNKVSEVDVGSAYLRYARWSVADVTLGRLKEPVGFERNTSVGSLRTIEGSMMSRAFTPSKSWGLHLFDANQTRRWAVAAVVEDNQNDRYEEDPPVAISGRYTFVPFNESRQKLQLGGGASIRDWNENVFQIRSSAEIGSADKVVRSARFIADRQFTGALEAVWRSDNLLLMAEYMATRVEELDGPEWDYSGYYFTASYLLTGEKQRLRTGDLESVQPENPRGAWELVARYSDLDVRDEGVGSVATVTTLGVNYYYSPRVRLMLNGLYTDIAGDTHHTQTNGYGASARLHIRF